MDCLRLFESAPVAVISYCDGKVGLAHTKNDVMVDMKVAEAEAGVLALDGNEYNGLERRR